MYTASEKLSSANITDIMQTAYIDYSMSVIISRALPDARDGLKPVQRRILYAMLREGLLHNRALRQVRQASSARSWSNYHPHGDASVYDTLVRLAQTWVMRYPLIDPQGNFGSVDGDPPAAYRYTECRLERDRRGPPARHRRGHGRLRPQLQRVDDRAHRAARRPAQPPHERLDRASPSAWRPTSRRTTWTRSSTRPAPSSTGPAISVDEICGHHQGPRLSRPAASSPAARASSATSRPAAASSASAARRTPRR